MTLGVTIGKFYPFHRGHEYLIREASAQVDHLVVLVGWKEKQALPGSLRADWIRSLHPEVEVIEVLDDLPEEAEPWAERTLHVLGSRRPDVVFTSEDYGPAYAAACGARSVVVDQERQVIPISGTALREDLASHWDMLTPPAKAWLARRVCVLGVESSGTTTLTTALAAHYGTVWVPEFGRMYWEGRRHAPQPESWDEDEFIQIARGQQHLEDTLATRASRVLIADTNALATSVWHWRYRGCSSKHVAQLAASCEPNLYVLTSPDFPFVQDGTREGESIRSDMHERFVGALEKSGTPWIAVGGPHEDRLAQALEAIDPLLVFAPIAPY